MPTHAFTIRKLADAGGASVETVRFYQRRGLLSEPKRVRGGFREYSEDDVRRLLFIKRAQECGFSLDDIAELASLSADRDSKRVREVAQGRLEEIRARVSDLEAMATALLKLVRRCERSAPGESCSIIAALSAARHEGIDPQDNGGMPSARTLPRRRQDGSAHLARVARS